MNNEVNSKAILVDENMPDVNRRQHESTNGGDEINVGNIVNSQGIAIGDDATIIIGVPIEDSEHRRQVVREFTPAALARSCERWCLNCGIHDTTVGQHPRTDISRDRCYVFHASIWSLGLTRFSGHL